MRRSDTIGISVATAGHILLLAALSLGLLNSRQVPPPRPASVDVSFVDATALESMTRNHAPAAAAVAPEQGAPEDAAPAPAPVPTPAEPVVKPVEPPPLAKPEPKPTPQPTPKPTPKPLAPAPAPSAKPKPKTVPEKPAPKAEPQKPKPKPEPARKVAPPAPTKAAPKKLDEKANPKTAAKAVTKPSAKTGSGGTGSASKPRGSLLGPNFLEGIGSDTKPSTTKGSPAPLGAAEAKALNQEITRQLKPYWHAPTGADADQLVTTLRWKLNRDGTIASGPELVSQSGQTDSNRPQQQLHVEAAIKAVRAAAPFHLPPEYYDYWKNIISFKFDRRL